VAVVVVTTESEDAAVAGGVLVGETVILVVLLPGLRAGRFGMVVFNPLRRCVHVLVIAMLRCTAAVSTVVASCGIIRTNRSVLGHRVRARG
jgi:site-specific recombinase